MGRPETSLGYISGEIGCKIDLVVEGGGLHGEITALFFLIVRVPTHGENCGGETLQQSEKTSGLMIMVAHQVQQCCAGIIQSVELSAR